MRKITDYMGFGIFGSPLLLGFPAEKVLIFSSKTAWVMALFYLPLLFAISMYDKEQLKDRLFWFMYAIVTYSIGVFLSMISLYYLFVCVYALVYLYLLAQERR